MINVAELRKGLLFNIDGFGPLPVMDFYCDFTGKLEHIKFLSAVVFNKDRVPSETVETVIVAPWQASPIPLTPAILEKCGFSRGKEDGNKSVFYGCARHAPIHSISAYGGIMLYRYGNRMLLEQHIKFLHQLQNFFFALIGEELIEYMVAVGIDPGKDDSITVKS